MIANRLASCALTVGLISAGCGGTDGGSGPGRGDAGGSGGSSGVMDAGGGPSDGEFDAAVDPRPDAGLPENKTRPKVQSVAPPYTVVDEVYKYEPKSDQSEAPEWKVKQGPPA